MNILSATFADLAQSDLGTKSRLASEVGGVPILRRTVERIASVPGIAKHLLLCPEAQKQRVRRIMDGLLAQDKAPAANQCHAPIEVIGVDGEPDPWRALTCAARKWSLDGWRGGLGGTTYFDEFCFPSLLARLLSNHQADAVFAYPAAAPLISQPITQRMLEHREKLGDDTRLVFSEAVPGLAGILLDSVLVRELADAKSPVGSLFSYKPGWPKKDLIFHSACLELPVELRYAAGRLVADTDRSVERVHAFVREIGDAPDDAIGQWLINRGDSHVEAFPSEVEIELTSDSPYPRSISRPGVVAPRGHLSVEVVKQLAAELGARDDALVVLGGFGDPLRHRHFELALECLVGQRPYGIALRTFAADLDDAAIKAMIQHKVDVCCVMLDAWSPELHQELHGSHGESRSRGGSGGTGLEDVLGRLNKLNEARQAARSIVPIVVPEFCKARDNVQEMDAFYDGWLKRMGTASIVGSTHRAGQRPDRSVVSMQPPMRTACRRIRSRCVVLANGVVTACDQDQEGRHALGSMQDGSLSEMWRSAAYRQLREVHARGDWANHPLCSKCPEWHRP